MLLLRCFIWRNKGETRDTLVTREETGSIYLRLLYYLLTRPQRN